MNFISRNHFRPASCLLAALLASSALAPRAQAGDQPKSFLHEYDGHWLGLLKLKELFAWVKDDPGAMFEEMRAHRPVIVTHAVPTRGKLRFTSTVMVALHQDVLEVLDHPEVFSVRIYGDKMNDTMGAFMLGRDVTPFNLVEKPYMRRIMKREDFPFIGREVARLASLAIQEGTTVDLDPKTGQLYGRLEVVNGLARKVPIGLTGTYAGFPGPDERTMYAWSRATQDDFFRNIKGDPIVHGRAVKTGGEMRAYLSGLIREKRAQLAKDPNSEDTLLARMLKEGGSQVASMTDERLIILTAGMLIGAGETTQAAVVKSVSELLNRPEQLAGAIKAARDNNDQLLGQYIWEALRFQPVNQVLPRYAETDYVLAKGTPRETAIKKGSLVLSSTQSAMFDEASVPSPKEFRLDRPASTYFHLGYGHHRCLGDYVSEVQVPQIVKALLLKKNLRRAPGAAGQIDNLGGGFPERFYLEFDF